MLKFINMPRCIGYLVGMVLIGFPAGAQQTGELKIQAIPFPLHWENAPEQFSVQGSDLVITAGPKTDMFRDPNVTYNTDNAPKLLFKADENCILTALIEHAFTQKWDGGALVIKQDSMHWIKFCFEKDYTGARRVVSVVTRDLSDDCNAVAIQGNSVFFKIAKAGDVITLYYSTNGKNWFLIRHLQFGFKPGFELGFLAQSPTGTHARVRFSRITYQARKIKDPYMGE